MWYVYFLRLRNADVYVGFAKDLKVRFARHRAGRVMSTRNLRPVELLCYIAVGSELAARALERYFKSGSGKAFAYKRLLRTSLAPA